MAKTVDDLILRNGKIVVLQDMVPTREVVSAAGIIEKLNIGPVTKASSGVVVNVAHDVTEFSLGDRLIFSPYCGFSMTYKGDSNYLLLSDHEIFGHYEGEVGDVEIA
ncbi:MAG: hypothetical protein QQN63_11910 [Nitrosopumilus sp.]